MVKSAYPLESETRMRWRKPFLSQVSILVVYFFHLVPIKKIMFKIYKILKTCKL